MGCDIHMFIEYKMGDTAWRADPHHVNEDEDEGFIRLKQVSATGRNYSLFAKMAGVRGEGPKARGLPKDVTLDIKTESKRQGGDAHSHSYLYLEDFQQIVESMGWDNCGSVEAFYNYSDFSNYEDQPTDFTTIINYCHKVKGELEAAILSEKHLLGADHLNTEVKVRLVFWFDN